MNIKDFPTFQELFPSLKSVRTIIDTSIPDIQERYTVIDSWSNGVKVEFAVIFSARIDCWIVKIKGASDTLTGSTPEAMKRNLLEILKIKFEEHTPCQPRVKDLIALLQTFPEDAEIEISVEGGGSHYVLDLESTDSDNDSNTVTIFGK